MRANAMEQAVVARIGATTDHGVLYGRRITCRLHNRRSNDRKYAVELDGSYLGHIANRPRFSP